MLKTQAANSALLNRSEHYEGTIQYRQIGVGIIGPKNKP